MNVDALGVVTVTAPGRGNVVVHAEGYRDTAWVTVVPNGTVTASRFSTADSSGVVVFDLDGSNFRLLARATSGVGGMAPSWAPDGGSVIYHHGVYQSNALHVVDLSGASRPLIGSHPTLIDAVWARYTRDGSWIYFSGRPENENFSLWRVRPDGTGAEQFHPTTNNPGIEWRPSISPDASKLAYITVGSFRGAAVKTISTATRAPDPWEVPGQTPVWSPDGTRIALTGSIGDGGIRVMRADGTGVRRVSERDHGYGEGLDWSSDGEWLIVRGAAGLELINVETGLTLPLPFSGELYEPNWKR